jgi:hypothetical protein
MMRGSGGAVLPLPHGRATKWMECKENKQVARVIRKLDKDTLNLYTPVRAELGTREPSGIGLVLNRLRPKHRFRMCMEARES